MSGKKPSSSSSSSAGAAAASSGSSSSGKPVRRTDAHTYSKVPLEDRLTDLMYVLWYLVMFAVVMPVALMSVTAHYKKVPLASVGEHLPFLSPCVIEAVAKFGEIADPTMNLNPGWLVAMQGFNLLVCGPLYLLTAFAFLFGWNWIRVPATINSVWTIYQIAMHGSETFFGGVSPTEPITYLVAYAPAVLISMATYKRLSMIEPFYANERGVFKAVALNAAFVVVMAEALAVVVFMAFRFAVLHLGYGEVWQHPHLVKARDFVLNDARGTVHVEELPLTQNAPVGGASAMVDDSL